MEHRQVPLTWQSDGIMDATDRKREGLASPPRRWPKWLAFGVVAMLLFGVIVYERYESYSATDRSEMARLQTLARVIDANLVIHLTAIDKLLLNVRDRQVKTLAPASRSRTSLPTVEELSFQVETTTGLRTIAVADAEGNFIASNRRELIGKNFANRKYFQTARQTSDPQILIVSEPFLTSLNVYGLQLVRPILGPNREFRGAVVVTLDPGFFKAMLSSALYSDDLRCLLIHQDGLVFEAVGEFSPKPGVNLANPGSLLSLHLASKQKESLLQSASYSTGDWRFAALRTVSLDDTPMDKHLVITFSRNTEKVFAAWRRETILGSLGFLVLLISSAIWLIFHQRQRRSAWQRDQDLHQERQTAVLAREQDAREIEDLYNHAPCGYHSLDIDGRIIRMNQTELDWLGLKREDVVGKLKFSDLLDAKGAESFRKNFPRFVQAGQAHDLEYQMRRQDGSSFTVLVSATAILDEDGRFLASRTTLTDITERKQAAAELNQHRNHLAELVEERTKELEKAKREAEVANHAKSLFLGNMSHEMRTPLHQISGVASLFRRDPLTDKQIQRMGLLETAVKRLDTVIGGILTLVDLESGVHTVKLLPINLEQVIGDVVKITSQRAMEKGLVLSHQVGPLPYPLLGDASSITTIVACFCSNAITFSDKGTIVIRAAAVSEDAGSILVRIAVEDQGVGIAPEHVGRLFEHFEQVDNSHTRKYGGTGVGLAIAKKLAKLMGGDVGCESTPGVGSTFWATLRLEKSPAVVGETAANPG